jgi:hypothetical protein
LVVVALVAYRWIGASRLTIGVEGRKLVDVAGPRLAATPFTPGDAVALRIAETTPVAGGFRYDLHYTLFGPGEFDLGKYLRRPDGSPPAAQPEFKVSVKALLPDDYSGELFDTPPSKINLHSGYRIWMTLGWLAWAALLVPLAWYGHKKRKRSAPPPPPPSIAERLRALLEQASHATLTVEQQANLEQLLLAFWSKRLGLSEERLIETVEQLRQHPEAGRQWSRVERWLHSRDRTANGSVARELLSELDGAR